MYAHVAKKVLAVVEVHGEHIGGGADDASHRHEAAKPLDESVIWSYFTQISEGLRHMHDLRMVCCARARVNALQLVISDLMHGWTRADAS